MEPKRGWKRRKSLRVTGAFRQWLLVIFSGLFLLFSLSCEREAEERGEIESLVFSSAQEGLPTHVAYLPRGRYPWELAYAGSYPKVTIEHFRCKGSEYNPQKGIKDCKGMRQHGLPLFQGKEGVYPILLYLLNWTQKDLGARVIVLSGHRCPVHQKYIDPEEEEPHSKHQIGAEVDFYLEGLELDPERIVDSLMRGYQTLSGAPPAFKRKARKGRETPAWNNEEIEISIASSHEGRNGDHCHPYPYVTIEVLYDRTQHQSVYYSWNRAHLGYWKGPPLPD